MKKELFKEIEIPKDVEIGVEGNTLTVRGKEATLKRKIDTQKLIFEVKDRKIRVGNKNLTKKEKKMMNTTVSHIKNMIRGVQKKFEYELKICFNHFPITVEVKGKEILVKNFLGEKFPRKVKIPEGADVRVDKDLIKVSSADKEIAGQAAANLETTTKIRARDRRVFQDGIFIINKSGKEI